MFLKHFLLCEYIITISLYEIILRNIIKFDTISLAILLWQQSILFLQLLMYKNIRYP